MSARFDVVLSDDLNRDIDKAVEANATNRGELMRKALQLYLAALDGKRRGLKLGLVDPKTEKMQTEFIGL
ncbi:transcriptional regulator [Massilia sp. DJPM01]|uniref:transcriptional regulator n=1 Tax=Massilia sp. DJPM01 TaxID=3024404 RepID=UPI00259E0F04|nr:transcriptional regulator [Massilia sp. DJPM01]MDM5180966.1 transcriptional regulator [Massilia sp. DJPM01]